MDRKLIALLRCPFCGGRLTLHDTGSAAADAQRNGILCCSCCAYPMVEGIPYLRTGPAAESAMRWLGDGNPDQALMALLGLSDQDRDGFERLRERAQPATFREYQSVLCPGPEGDYLFHRFSDPTFVCSEGVIRAIAQERRCMSGRVLDICGGAGHLTRTLCENAVDVIYADLSFAKLWLARRFVAPRSVQVCCDAGETLPFVSRSFSLVHCADAFHYIWRRRALAGEMIRLLDDTGTIVLTHLHNLLGDNVSAGMPLAPAEYRELFGEVTLELFKESDVFESLLARQGLSFAVGNRDEELAEESALVLVASRLPGIYRVYERDEHTNEHRQLRRNPLYVAQADGEGEVWTLRLPSEGYELEYARCRRYLPEKIRLRTDEITDLQHGRIGKALAALAERRVLLDLPDGYEQW